MNNTNNKNMINNKYKTIIKFLLPVIILNIISLIDMYSSNYISSLYKDSFVRQVIWVILGYIVLFLIYKVNDRGLFLISKYLYIIGIILLVGVLYFGIEINGSKAWFSIFGFYIEPSELFKFPFIIYISYLVSIKAYIKSFILFLIPVVLIYLEPDTGLLMMYILIYMGIILNSNINKKSIYILLSISIFIGISILYMYFYNIDLFINIFGNSIYYRINRLLDFTNNTSYQLNMALYGIVSSKYIDFNIVSSKVYVPFINTDFAFTLSIETLGIVGGIFIILLYSYIVYSIYKVLLSIKNNLYKSILGGFIYMFLFQIIEHIYMNIGLLPITGITLPFISYGGSSLLSYFMLYGLILKITTNKSSYNQS